MNALNNEKELSSLTWYPLPRVAGYVRPEAVADDVDLGGVQPQNLHQPRHLQAHQPGHIQVMVLLELSTRLSQCQGLYSGLLLDESLLLVLSQLGIFANQTSSQV